MAEVYGYFNGLEYDEKFPMMRVASLIPTGVYNDSLHVSAGTGLTVYVAAGKAWVNGYFYSSDATRQITIDIADADNTRKDIIVLRLDTVNRRMEVAYKKGNPSVYPTPPTLQRNNDVYELQLAEILVPAGSASISAATITDTRSDSGLCGITAGFQGLDVDVLTEQVQAQFDTWFANLKNQLDSNQAGNLQNQIDGINNSKGKAGGLMALPSTLPATGKILKMGAGGAPAEATSGTDYATINGFAGQAWADMSGIDTSALKFIGVTGLDENQQYLINITGNYNPNGSPYYRASLCGILTLPILYNGGVVTVKAVLTPLLSTTGTSGSADANFAAVFEGGANTLPYSTWSSNKMCYIKFSRESTSPTIGYWIIKIKKLL